MTSAISDHILLIVYLLIAAGNFAAYGRPGPIEKSRADDWLGYGTAALYALACLVWPLAVGFQLARSSYGYDWGGRSE